MTNSERRVQRVRKALDPPGEARDDMWIIAELARRLGHDWGRPAPRRSGTRCARCRRCTAGCGTTGSRRSAGSSGRAPTRSIPGSPFLHERLWAEPLEGPPAPFSVVAATGPFEALDAEYPIRLTTGRRLESYNTGAQSSLYRSPLHKGEFLDLSPEDAERLELADGEIVRVSSRRGSVEAPVRIDPSLRAGLAFMTFHFPDQVDVNQLTIDATDPKSGTAEFKATAIRVEKLAPAEREARAGVAEPAAVRRASRMDHQPRSRGRADARPSAPRSTRVLGPPATAGKAAPPTRGRGQHCGSAGTTPARGAICCCPRSGRCRSGSAGSAPAALNDLCRAAHDSAGRRLRRRLVLRAARARAAPARVVHVCEDLACRCHGSEELIAQLEERFGAEGELSDDGSATWYRSPCLGQCDRAPAAMLTVAGDEPIERAQAPTTAAAVLGSSRSDAPGAGARTVRCPQAGDPSAAPAPAIGSVDAGSSTSTAPTAATRRCGARSSSGPTA